MATRKNNPKSNRTTTPEPFAASDKQFAADIWAKALTGEFLAAGRPFVDESDDTDTDEFWMMAEGLIAMYKDYERSQQPKVDAEIRYLDPSA